jgi:hypothetical protein
MEPVKIEPVQTLREGIDFRFHGQLMDEADSVALSEPVDIVLTIPPLNFKLFKKWKPKLETFQSAPVADSMETLAGLVCGSLLRNYRGVPRWLVESTIDLANMSDLTEALLDVNGLKRKEIEEGKVKAAERRSTGMSSTVI